MSNQRKPVKAVSSSGNPFVNAELSAAEEQRTKTRLAVAINQILRRQDLSQKAAGRLLAVTQPKVSAIVNYRLDGFSVERLLHFLNSLGQDVEIVIRSKPRSRRSATIVVRAA